jgi:hypothetical protein
MKLLLQTGKNLLVKKRQTDALLTAHQHTVFAND